MNEHDEIVKPLSRHQYGSLRYFSKGSVTLDQLRNAHATTLGSLLIRGYLQKQGSVIVLTKRGGEALRLYDQATINERSHEGDLTERCLKLLRYSRRVVAMSRAA